MELAVLLPFLLFIFVAAVDFGRIFYYEVAVTNCARSGALYGSTDATHAADTQGIQTVAKAEAPELTSAHSPGRDTQEKPRPEGSGRGEWMREGSRLGYFAAGATANCVITGTLFWSWSRSKPE